MSSAGGDGLDAAVPPVKPAAARPGTAASSTGARQSWLGRAAAKVPTKWLTAAVVGLFLVATAAFGGLEPVEAAGPVELTAGETHAGPIVALTIQRAVLIDDFVEAGASADADAGERVLALVVDAENVSTQPVQTLTATFGEVLRLEALPELAMEGAARLDDATIGPTLQPGAPAQVVLSWVVPGDALAAGDELRIRLFDHELHVGQSVAYGEFWDDEVLAAVVTVELDDVGAGADAEDGG